MLSLRCRAGGVRPATQAYLCSLSRLSSLPHATHNPIVGPFPASATRPRTTTTTTRPFSSTPATTAAAGAPTSNIPPRLKELIGRNLHHQQNHPIHIIKTLVENHFEAMSKPDVVKQWKPAPLLVPPKFKFFDNLDPVVKVRHNFDELQVPVEHVSRSPNDTFYVQLPGPSPTGDELVLRTHTSAHQTSLLREGHNAFLMTGDVYRRDEVDSSHYPVFHQMEGVRVYSKEEINSLSNILGIPNTDEEARGKMVLEDLKLTLETLAYTLFGRGIQIRWVDAYFPFTHPSAEMEIFFQEKWLEVLGCGVVHPKVMEAGGMKGEAGYAFGLGLERLAMVLFSIPDIRLFWTQDPRFLSQFKEGVVTRFEPYSKFPVCYKDVTFWLPPSGFHENSFYEMIREVAGDLVEQVEMLDKFTHPKTGKVSHCYRISYRSMDRSLTNAEIDELQFKLRDLLVSQLHVELR